jgi:hypothetical protein
MKKPNEQPRILRCPDGKILPLPIFDLVYDQIEHPEVIQQLSRNGIGTFSARTLLLIGGKQETESIRQIVEKTDVIAQHVPEAMILLSIKPEPSAEWRQKNPGELTVSEDGRYTLAPVAMKGHFRKGEVSDEEIWESAEPSVFSEKEAKDIAKAIKRLFGILQAKPYAKRLVGAFIQKYVYGEWAVPHWYPDNSKAAKTFLEKFLKEKYGNISKLREAWNEPDASFKNPPFPYRESMYHRLNLGGLAVDSQAMKDYLEAEAMAHAKKFYSCCKAVKACNPKYLGGGFFGYGHPYQTELRSFLNDDTIDFVCTPMEYFNREPGGGVSTQSPYCDMPPLHGKVFFDELDTATHIAPKVMNNVGRPHNAWESTEVMWRDTGQMLVNGHAGWYLDFGGHAGHASCSQYRKEYPRKAYSWHIAPSLLGFHKQFRQLWDKVDSFDRASVADVKVFFPRRNGRFQALGYAKRVEFPMVGLPLLECELDDLLQGYTSPGKLNILYWPASLKREEFQKLKDILENSPAHWLVYGPAALIDADVTSTPAIEKMEELTGFSLEVAWSTESALIPKAVPTGKLAKSKLLQIPYVGQSLKPFKSKNVIWLPGLDDLRKKPEPPAPSKVHWQVKITSEESLALHEDSDDVAFAVRKNSAGGQVYLYQLPCLNSNLLRVIADWAGVHLYLKEDVYLVVKRGLLLLHQARDGEYEINLPESPKKVIDLRTGKVISHKGKKLLLTGKTGSTHLLQICHKN